MNKIEGRMDVIDNSYEWVISDFSKYVKTGEFIRSPIFSFIKNNVVREWQLSLYPCGKSEIFKNYLSLYFRSHNNQEIKVRITVSFLNNHNKSVFEQSGMVTFTKAHNSSGFHSFIPRAAVANEKNGLLQDDKLRIKWELASDHPQSKAAGGEDEVPRMLEHLDYFEKLLDDKEFSDVEVTVDGFVLQAHKCILACKSSVFAEMFAEQGNKARCKITVTGMSYDSCREMLRFVYVGNVRMLDKIVYELALGAKRYNIEGLKKLCEDFLCGDFTFDGALTLLQFSDQFDMDTLKARVLEFIVNNRKEIIDVPSFKSVGRILPADLIFELFRAIVNIAE